MSVKFSVQDFQSLETKRLLMQNKHEIMDTKMSPSNFEKIWSPVEKTDKTSIIDQIEKISMKKLDQSSSSDEDIKKPLDLSDTISSNRTDRQLFLDSSNHNFKDVDNNKNSGRLSFSVDSLLSTISQSKSSENPEIRAEIRQEISPEKAESDEELDVEDSDDYVDDEDDEDEESGSRAPGQGLRNESAFHEPGHPGMPPFLAAFLAAAASGSHPHGAPIRPLPNWPMPGPGFHPGFNGIPSLHHPLFKNGMIFYQCL